MYIYMKHGFNGLRTGSIFGMNKSVKHNLCFIYVESGIWPLRNLFLETI